jgi:hypothetical protein
MKRIPVLGMRDEAFPEEGFHERITNGHVDEEGVWFASEGAIRIRDFGGGSDIIEVFEWTRRGNQRWLIIESVEDDETTNIFFYDWQADTVSLITTRRYSPAAPVGSTFLPLGNWLYILTPGDTPIRWDGHRLEPVGFQVPSAPLVSGPSGGFTAYDSAAASSLYVRKDPVTQRGVGPYPDDQGIEPADLGVGPSQPWRVGYALTWINTVGSESPPSPLAITSGANLADLEKGRQAVFLEIPPGPPGAVAGRLWRTPNLQDVTEPSGASLFLVDEFAHASGHTHIDLTPDGELNILLDDSGLGVPPVQPPTGAFWGGFVWFVDGDDRTTLRRSSLLLQEQFSDEAYYKAGSAHTGEIVALVPHQRSMILLKERGVFAMVDPDAAPRVISEAHGTTAPKAAVVVPGLGILYLDSTAGPSVIYGTLQDEQSTGIKPLPGIRRTWRKLASRYLHSARVLYDATNREVVWSIPTGGGTRNSLVLVYHLLTEAWSLRPDWPVDSMVITSSGHILAGTRQLQPGLDILTYGAIGRDPQEVPVELSVRTAWLEALAVTTYQSAELLVDAVGAVTVDVVARADRRPVDIDQTEQGKQLVQPDHDRDAWSSGLWGAAYSWTDIDPGRVVVDLHERTTAHSYQLRMTGARLRLYSLLVHTTDDQALPYRRERVGGSLP